MKCELLWAVLKNFGRLLSFDFWWMSITKPDYPTWLFVKMIVISGFSDILLMILKPGYPPKLD